MADVTNLDVHHHQRPNPQQQQQQQQKQNSISQTLDSIPNCSNNENQQYDFDAEPFSPPHVSSFNFHQFSHSGSESDSYYPDSDSDSYGFYSDDHINFVTDLFASREERALDLDDHDSVSDPFWDTQNADSNFRVLGRRYNDFDSNTNMEELGLGFGPGIEFDRVAFPSESIESSAIGGSDSGLDGLRVVRMESDSDSAEGPDPIGDSDIPLFWDCLGYEDQRAANEELEWEEVEGRVDEREGLSLVINQIEELSVSSELSNDEDEMGGVGEEAVRSLEWEVLLAVNNWARPSDFEPYGEGVSYLDVEDGDVYDTEYDTIFGAFVQNESALKGSPPASKSVVESLPLMVLTKEELEEENVVCAVCKDEILVEENVTKLPCHHYYHGDCIVPWLGIRNTCPVCRFELPTDDPDYEQRKTQRGGLDLPLDLEVLENSEGVWDSGGPAVHINFHKLREHPLAKLRDFGSLPVFVCVGFEDNIF